MHVSPPPPLPRIQLVYAFAEGAGCMNDGLLCCFWKALPREGTAAAGGRPEEHILKTGTATSPEPVNGERCRRHCRHCRANTANRCWFEAQLMQATGPAWQATAGVGAQRWAR
eukprot:366279-Chlamydomonas_euryale.AAC.6